MSLNAFLMPVIPRFPNVTENGEVEVLQELPVETLYLALKKADAESLAWFYETALPEQIQGIVDIDCWNGDNFLPERFEQVFRSMIATHPVKLQQLMKRLDPEIIVRGLLEMCEVGDFDPQDPPDLEENQFILSPDSKYILVFRSQDPETREMLMQWMNKLATADLELLRRHLESCKWEQKADLEEFGHRIKSGRLEEMGFVDRTEAVALYARGNGVEYKKKLLANPLPDGSKRSALAAKSEDGGEETLTSDMNPTFLPQILSEPIFGEGLFSQALSRVDSPELKNLLLSEVLRTFNGAMAADEVIHGTLEEIATATSRARRYVDLGLAYLSDNNMDLAARQIEQYPLGEIFRLGWLVSQDLVKVAQELRVKYGASFFGRGDEEIINGLTGRHPELTPEMRRELGINSDTLLTTEAILKAGIRLAMFAQIAQFFSREIAAAVNLEEKHLLPQESAYARLLAALFREAAGQDIEAGPLSISEWDRFRPLFQSRGGEARLQEAATLIVGRTPDTIRLQFERRLKEHVEELLAFLKSKPEGRPDPRFFRAMAFVDLGDGAQA